MKVSILYQTRYAYEQPVSFSPHLFRLFPRPASHLRIHACAFSTNPDAVVQHRRDLFDNPTHSLLFTPYQSHFNTLRMCLPPCGTAFCR